MFKTYQELERFVKERDIEAIDFKYTDLFGRMRHFNYASVQIERSFYKECRGV